MPKAASYLVNKISKILVYTRSRLYLYGLSVYGLKLTALNCALISPCGFSWIEIIYHRPALTITIKRRRSTGVDHESRNTRPLGTNIRDFKAFSRDAYEFHGFGTMFDIESGITREFRWCRNSIFKIRIHFSRGVSRIRRFPISSAYFPTFERIELKIKNVRATVLDRRLMLCFQYVH